MKKQKEIIEQRRKDKEVFSKVIANNLRIAREINGFSQKKVMQDIFNSDGSNLNRVSEIETGIVLPSFWLIARLACYYNVSTDFIFGRTNQPDFLAEDAYVGRAVADLRETGLMMMDKVTQALLKQVEMLPNASLLELLETNKKFINDVLICQDNVFKDKYSYLRNYVAKLNSCVIGVERETAKTRILQEIAFEDVTNAETRIYESKLYTERRNKAPLKKYTKLMVDQLELPL